MDDAIEELVIDVRATTDGFASDMAQMKGVLDSSLLDGFERAGSVLERGLMKAIRTGSLGFDDLKRAAFQAIDQIAAQAIQSGLGSLFSGQSGGGVGGLLGGFVGALFGLPGRATGGPVSPGRGYVVGERGPELFVPTSAGRVESGTTQPGTGRDVRVAIQLAAPRGTAAPTAMRRSSRQVASAVRRALQDS
ncbi:tail tape measure protein [Erythrobacteraceae bacterium E2-1 Yellow Sea]|nr:tail tape measure protein [Erythrobacteraceae bacterium E2-1 Yellow Sea]